MDECYLRAEYRQRLCVWGMSTAQGDGGTHWISARGRSYDSKSRTCCRPSIEDNQLAAARAGQVFGRGSSTLCAGWCKDFCASALEFSSCLVRMRVAGRYIMSLKLGCGGIGGNDGILVVLGGLDDKAHPQS